MPFVEKVIEYNGKKFRGVFPKFEYLFRLRVPESLYTALDDEQFLNATRALKYAINEDTELSKKFTQQQLDDIQNEEPRITDLTWHHNEEVGILELVDRQIHLKTNHTGGRNIWGGGTLNR